MAVAARVCFPAVPRSSVPVHSLQAGEEVSVEHNLTDRPTAKFCFQKYFGRPHLP